MAKTNFVHGTTVTSTFLNSIYNTSGGHKHDGVDEEGHAGKILLTNTAEVTGRLPISNIDITPDFISGGRCSIYAGNNYSIKVESCCAIAKNDTSKSIKSPILIKQIKTGGFAAGDNQCGVAAGVTFDVDDILHVFLIANDTVGVDVGIDSDEDAANLIAELGIWTLYRRISSVKIKSIDGNNGVIYPFDHFGDRYIYQDGGMEVGPVYTFVDADFYDQGGGIYHAWTPAVVPWVSSRSIEVIFDIFPTTADGVSVRVVPNNLTAYLALLSSQDAWMTCNVAGSKTVITKRFAIENSSAHMLVQTYGLPGSISIMIRGYIDKRI